VVDDAVFDDESSPHAANERSAIAATESTADRGPRCRFIFAPTRSNYVIPVTDRAKMRLPRATCLAAISEGTREEIDGRAEAKTLAAVFDFFRRFLLLHLAPADA
jgi:hypothetical protein